MFLMLLLVVHTMATVEVTRFFPGRMVPVLSSLATLLKTGLLTLWTILTMNKFWVWNIGCSFTGRKTKGKNIFKWVFWLGDILT